MTMLSRRSFVAGALGAGVLGASFGLAGCAPSVSTGDDKDSNSGKYSFEIAPDPVPEDKIAEVQDYDVVVVGGGPAGFFAAVSAAESGAHVTVITDIKVLGGTGSGFFGPNSKAMKAAGAPEMDLMKLARRRLEDNEWRANQEIWFAGATYNTEAIDWLTDIMSEAGYEADCGGAIEDVMDETDGLPFSYRGHIAWYSDDFSVTCVDLVMNVLAERAEALGCDIQYSTPGRQLVQDEAGAVVGVIAERDGEYIRINASKGVILATGDFTLDKEMMAKYAPEWADFPSGGKCDGAGHKMALWAGGAWQDYTPNCAMPDFVTGAIANPRSSSYSFPGLLVNKRGKRFMNEDIIAAFAANTVVKQPEYLSFAVWDSAYLDNNEWSDSNFYRSADPAEIAAQWDASVGVEESIGWGCPVQHTVKADSLEELAEMAGLPADALAESIAQYNAMCDAEFDTDFGKDARFLQPVKEPPFYIQYGTPWNLCMCGGIQVDRKLRVVNADKEPIPGLYAVGTMVGSLFDTYDYKCAGANLGICCCTFGYMAGRNIVAE